MTTTSSTIRKKNPVRNFVTTLFALAVVGAGVFGIGAALIGGAKHEIHSYDTHIGKDVTIGDCAVNPVGSATAALVISNHSSGLSDYSIEVAFYDTTGLHVANGYALASQVAPQAQVDAEADSTGAVSGPLTCKVTSVTRTASP